MKDKPKMINIASLEDLCNAATPENINLLAADLGAWIRSYCDIIQGIREVYPNEHTEGKTNWELAQGSFEWTIDDKPGTITGLEFEIKD